MSEIRVHIKDHIAHLVLAAPHRRNALTSSMAQELVAACDAIDADDSVGAVVIDGGSSAFCAGAHRSLLEAVGRNALDAKAIGELRLIYSSFTRVGQLNAPTIAAIRGSVVGAGVNLAAATDIRIAAIDARIISGFQRIGVHPGGGHFALLARSMGFQAAAALTVFDQEVDGARAESIGLVWEAHPASRVLPRAMEIASRVASDPQLARTVARTARAEFGPPPVSWDIGLEMELAPQLWSLSRKAGRANSNVSEQ